MASEALAAVSRGCYLKAYTEEVRLKPRFKDKQWVNAGYCLRQRVPEVFAPFLSHMFNASVQQGYVTSIFKSAFITSSSSSSNLFRHKLNKHRCLEILTLTRPMWSRTDIKSISLIQVTWALGRATATRLSQRSSSTTRLPVSVSVVFHSTETTILKVMSDILLALDSGDLALLTLLDLLGVLEVVRAAYCAL